MAGERSFTKLGAGVAELEKAAADRLADAEILLAGDRYASAVVMGYYALEIRLKAAICRRLDLDRLPRAFEIHDLEDLLLLSGLSRKITNVKRPRGVEKNWDELLIKTSAINDLRYSTDSKAWNRIWASRILSLLRDQANGVIPWLSKQA